MERDYQNLHSLKMEWEDILDIKAKGSMMRSKAKWIEFGEKKFKIFSEPREEKLYI